MAEQYFKTGADFEYPLELFDEDANAAVAITGDMQIQASNAEFGTSSIIKIRHTPGGANLSLHSSTNLPSGIYILQPVALGRLLTP
jgi:hypothetical protein